MRNTNTAIALAATSHQVSWPNVVMAATPCARVRTGTSKSVCRRTGGTSRLRGNTRARGKGRRS
ncbi:hypothetical protein DSL05_15990 [Mycobacterium tuberculosis]|nr:hypothetical protein DSL05_15990 [Mycobacterium tuberculosis]